MSETPRDLVVSLSLHSDHFTRNIKSIQKQIQEAESAFRPAGAGVEKFEGTAAGLSTKAQTLSRTLSLQKDAVLQYQRTLAQACTQLQAFLRACSPERVVDKEVRFGNVRKTVKSAAFGAKRVSVGEECGILVVHPFQRTIVAFNRSRVNKHRGIAGFKRFRNLRAAPNTIRLRA